MKNFGRVIVSVAKNDDPSKATDEAIDLLGGMSRFVKRGDRVVIKPNLTFDRPADTGATTDPRVVKRIAELCQEEGAGEVIVAESSAVGVDTERAFEVNGIRKAVSGLGVKILDIKRNPFVKVRVPDGHAIGTVEISSIVLSCDVLINVPKLKTHDQLPVTLGLKNMKGVIPDEEKKRFHSQGLSWAIVDLNRLVKPDLTVIDGSIAMEGLGPIFGDRIKMGIVVASEDIVAADGIASKIMGFNPKKIDHIRFAWKSGIGTLDFRKIKVVGRSVGSVKRKFKAAPSSLLKIPGLTLIEGGACSGCRNTLASVVYDLRQMGKEQLLKGRTIVLGQKVKVPKDLPEDALLIGKCLRNHMDRGKWVSGCPPKNAWILGPLGVLGDESDYAAYAKNA